jgi:predicted nucleic acid-binding protein
LKEIVIDASVVLKWYLADEEYGQRALGILDKHLANEIAIIAPSLLEYEVINGLMIAKKRGRMQAEKIQMAIDGFVSLDLKLKNLSFFYSKIIELCEVHHLSAYDAAYLALASEEGIPFITADEELYKAVKKDLNLVIWLGDYKYPDN